MIDLHRVRRDRLERLARQLRLSAVYVHKLEQSDTAALLLEGPPYIAGKRVMVANPALTDDELGVAADLCARHAGSVYYRVSLSELERGGWPSTWP